MRGHYHCLRPGCFFVTNITTKLPWHVKKHEKAERRAANGFKYFTKREECGRLGKSHSSNAADQRYYYNLLCLNVGQSIPLCLVVYRLPTRLIISVIVLLLKASVSWQSCLVEALLYTPAAQNRGEKVWNHISDDVTVIPRQYNPPLRMHCFHTLQQAEGKSCSLRWNC